jgi:hypothetical protein
MAMNSWEEFATYTGQSRGNASIYAVQTPFIEDTMASHLLLLLLILPSTLARLDVFNLVLDAPEHPPAGQQVVDANYQSYSIEFSYMQDYAGNNT